MHASTISVENKSTLERFYPQKPTISKMKPTSVITILLLALAGQGYACANQGDACGGAQVGDTICGCFARGNQVSQYIPDLPRPLTCRS